MNMTQILLQTTAEIHNEKLQGITIKSYSNFQADGVNPYKCKNFVVYFDLTIP